MTEPKTAATEAMAAMVRSPEFAAVKAAADALDPVLLIAPGTGAHLKAFRIGMNALHRLFGEAEVAE